MSMTHTTQPSDASDTHFLEVLPEWKQALWHDISVAARTRKVFDIDGYDMNGDLKPHSTRFAELRTWFVCLTHFHPAVNETSCRILKNMLAGCTTHQSSI